MLTGNEFLLCGRFTTFALLFTFGVSRIPQHCWQRDIVSNRKTTSRGHAYTTDNDSNQCRRLTRKGPSAVAVKGLLLLRICSSSS